ncbi:ATP-binding protein [Candidatus Phycosocius spiralis]|uniref:ATPase n=1 Tax=Candidatus Phycosocius spiralis TaxID=2815099 RepID=A0ABQ4PVS0_9PROT|nr:ATP-binding protein [Candidatus Phycosocius spiralis]GIU67071.1 ATPase [Candidatus Phycosocius spiralis]
MVKIQRPEALRRILTALDRAPAVVLLGARQIGKTTLARQIALEKGESALLLDLERGSDLRKLADPETYLRHRIGALTIIDEVHRAPRLFEELRWLIDEGRQNGQHAGQFLLLGSASLDLIQKSSETLAGRVHYIELSPIQPQEAHDHGLALDQLWLRGGFPESLLSADDQTSLAWRENFIRSYLERDIPLFAPSLPSEMIGRLWTMLANGQGTLLNASKLATNLSVSAPTISRYIDLLVDLLLIRRLQPWVSNVQKRLVKSPKIYVRDSGIVHALLEIGSLEHLLGHPIIGLSWEGHVIDALIGAAGARARPYFYATSQGAEIDLIFEVAGKPAIAIEIKRSSTAQFGRGFLQACDDLGIENRIVVYNGTESFPMKGGVQAHGLLSAMQAVKSTVAGPFARSS